MSRLIDEVHVLMDQIYPADIFIGGECCSGRPWCEDFRCEPRRRAMQRQREVPPDCPPCANCHHDRGVRMVRRVRDAIAEETAPKAPTQGDQRVFGQSPIASAGAGTIQVGLSADERYISVSWPPSQDGTGDRGWWIHLTGIEAINLAMLLIRKAKEARAA